MRKEQIPKENIIHKKRDMSKAKTTEIYIFFVSYAIDVILLSTRDWIFGMNEGFTERIEDI